MKSVRFFEIKVGFLFQYKGRMCRKTHSDGWRHVHNTDKILYGDKCFAMLNPKEPVLLYLQENGLRLVDGKHVVKA